jgi:hypothetical protein
VSPLEYITASIDDWPQYLMLVVLFIGLHAFVIRRWTVGIYDPLLMLLLSNALSWAIVWFMYLRGDIASVYALTFTAAQLALYLGMGVGRLFSGRTIATPMPQDGTSLPTWTLAMAAAVHVASTVAIWTLAGIPLFRDSRLGGFHNSGGLGILERLADSSSLIGLFSVTYLLLGRPHLRRNLLILAFLCWYVTTMALSGSKGALLSVGQYLLSIMFVYGGLRMRRDRFWGGRAGKWLVALSTLFAIAVVALQQASDLESAAVGLLFRIVSYGDIYIFAYPDRTIESLSGANPLVGMFGGFLSTFRLFPQESLHTSIGLQFTQIVFPDLDLFVGPNPQHPVFGYHYFGSFGFVFSFVLGLLTMAVHTGFYFKRHSSFFMGLVSFVLYFALFGISLDFEYSMSMLANMIIGLVAIVGPVLLLHPRAVLWGRPAGQPRRVKYQEGLG